MGLIPAPMAMTYTHADLASKGLYLARWGVLGMATSMPISRAAFNLSALVMVAGWLLSGDLRGKWDMVRRDATCWFSVGLFAVLAMSTVYSTAGWSTSAAQLVVYSKLLYIPLIFTLLIEPRWNRRAWLALKAGLLFTLAVFVLDIWLDIPGTRTFGQTPGMDRGVFYHHIAQGMAMALLGALALHEALQPRPAWQRVAWALVLVANVMTMMWVNESRAGQLSVLAALTLTAFTHAPHRWRWIGVCLTGIFVVTLSIGSDRLRDRFQLAWKEAIHYQVNGESTSVGARLQAWDAAWQAIRSEPILGHGAGAYQRFARSHFSESPICALGVCEQPHNQFVLTTFECGLLGLLALVGLLLSPLFGRSDRASNHSALTLPLLGIFLVTALFDSSLTIRAQGYLFVTTMGLLLASRIRT